MTYRSHSQQSPELDVEAESEIVAEESMRLCSFVNKQTSLPTLLLQDETSQPAYSLNTNNLDYSVLVELRRLHQTRHAAEGIRTRDVAVVNTPEESIRRKLIRELNALLRQEENRAQGTGQDRTLRWLAPVQGETDSIPENRVEPVPAGNSANAAVVAQLRMKKVVPFCSHHAPC